MKLADIVAKLGGEAVGEVSAPLTGVATLDSAGPGHIAFLANPRYRSKLASTRAAAVIVGPGDRAAATTPCIVSDNPYAYYAKTVALFNPEPPVKGSIHPFAQIDGTANVDATSEIGPFVVIGPGANVAAGASIGAHCVLGEGVQVGAHTRLYPRVTVYNGCRIGEHTVIAGCTGISGSVTIGRNCVIGGGVGFVGHISICDNTSVSGYSFVTKSVTQPGTYTSGMPFMPHAEWLRTTTYIRRLYKTARGLRKDPQGEALEPDDD